MRERRTVIYLVIRYGLVALLLFGIIFFIFRKHESKTPFDDMSVAVAETITSDHLERNSTRFLKKYFDLNPDDYDGVMIYTPRSNMDAEELVLIKLSSNDQAEAITRQIEARIQSQYEIYEGYAPEEVALLDGAIIDVQGNYILYVVGDFAQDTDEVFRKKL